MRRVAVLVLGAVLAVVGVRSSGGDLASGASRYAAGLEAYDAVIPDDHILLEQLEEAVELRRREDFDRVLDAKDPGELIEHATLKEKHFEHRELGIDTLFIVGDELFGYLFRPENGWGRGGQNRQVIDYTPQLSRVHRGRTGGPDAFGCFSCHFKGGPDGAGTQTQVAFFNGDGERLAGADQRNAPHLLGLGPIAALAIEMSADLKSQATKVSEQAKTEGKRTEQPLATKGVRFGRIIAAADGRLDYSAVEGIDADLIVRPFGWKGHQATLRDMVEESLHLHQGLLSADIEKAVHAGTRDGAIYGTGRHWYDLDDDGVNAEIDSGMLSTVVGYLSQLEAPVTQPPRDPGLLDQFAAGRTQFESLGCAGCHVPALQLINTKFETRPAQAADRESFILDVAKDGEVPKIEPMFATVTTPYLVHLFSDLKRHDMGDGLATPTEQNSIPPRVFLTRPLWDLADTAPYLHDGRAPTVHEAIIHHGGEAQTARDAYLALGEDERAAVRVFLASLGRHPKLFVP